ncbi:uncharacterized protein LOC130656351 isoform X2 [Hydractinia symbiolongicarpus]|nr:uncharacterized protein LOC130656351 isoform X2 [Hydractinia symbiolongicarpus]
MFRVIFVALFCVHRVFSVGLYNSFLTRKIAKTDILREIQVFTYTDCYMTCELDPECFVIGVREHEHTDELKNCVLIKKDYSTSASNNETVEILTTCEDCLSESLSRVTEYVPAPPTVAPTTGSISGGGGGGSGSGGGGNGSGGGNLNSTATGFSMIISSRTTSVPVIIKPVDKTPTHLSFALWLKVKANAIINYSYFVVISFLPPSVCNDINLTQNKNYKTLGYMGPRSSSHLDEKETSIEEDFGTWRHVALMWDVANKKVYVYENALLKKTIDSNLAEFPIPMTSIQVTLGNDVDLDSGSCAVNNEQQGVLADYTEFFLWTRSISVDEIKEAYNHNPNLDGALFTWNDFHASVLNAGLKGLSPFTSDSTTVTTPVPCPVCPSGKRCRAGACICDKVGFVGPNCTIDAAFTATLAQRTTKVPILVKNTSTIPTKLSFSFFIMLTSSAVFKYSLPLVVAFLPSIFSCNEIFLAQGYTYKILIDERSLIVDNTNIPQDIGKWNHITILYDTSAKSIKLYLNAQEVYSKTVSTLPVPGPEMHSMMIVLGNDADPSGSDCVVDNSNQGIKGKFTHFFVWNRHLSLEEIKSAYFLDPPYDGMFVSWDEFRAPTAASEATVDVFPFN